MEPDVTRLRETVETLERIDRPSASAGEREAAEWIRDRLTALGVPARTETAPAHGTYWWPEGLASLAGGLAGLAAGRRPGLRALSGLVAAAAAASIADDVSGGPHLLRKLLPTGETTNVVAEIGPADATLGEMSIALGKALGGADPNPRTSAGTPSGTMLFVVFPKSAAKPAWPLSNDAIDAKASQLLDDLGGQDALLACADKLQAH